MDYQTVYYTKLSFMFHQQPHTTPCGFMVEVPVCKLKCFIKFKKSKYIVPLSVLLFDLLVNKNWWIQK